MFEVSKFNMGGQDIYVKDAQARQLISGLQSDVVGANQRINTLDLRTKNVINFDYTVFVGDDFLSGYGLQYPSTQNWGYLFSQIVKCSKARFLANPGMGFCNQGTNGLNAASYLVDSASSIEDKAKVTCVIVCLGFSDRTYSSETIRENVRTFWGQCGSIFPNANFVYLVNPTFGCMTRDNMFALYDVSTLSKITTIDSWWWFMLHYGQFQEDRIHLNQYGQERMSKYLFSSLTGGRVYTGVTSNMSLGGGWTVEFKTECDKIQLLVAGDYPQETDQVKVGEFADGMFEANGPGRVGPFNKFRHLAAIDIGPNNFGVVLWDNNSKDILVRAMWQLANSTHLSTGYFHYNELISPSILFG